MILFSFTYEIDYKIRLYKRLSLIFIKKPKLICLKKIYNIIINK